MINHKDIYIWMLQQEQTIYWFSVKSNKQWHRQHIIVFALCLSVCLFVWFVPLCLVYLVCVCVTHVAKSYMPYDCWFMFVWFVIVHLYDSYCYVLCDLWKWFMSPSLVCFVTLCCCDSCCYVCVLCDTRCLFDDTCHYVLYFVTVCLCDSCCYFCVLYDCVFVWFISLCQCAVWECVCLHDSCCYISVLCDSVFVRFILPRLLCFGTQWLQLDADTGRHLFKLMYKWLL